MKDDSILIFFVIIMALFASALFFPRIRSRIVKFNPKRRPGTAQKGNDSGGVLTASDCEGGM